MGNLTKDRNNTVSSPTLQQCLPLFHWLFCYLPGNPDEDTFSLEKSGVLVPVRIFVEKYSSLIPGTKCSFYPHINFMSIRNYKPILIIHVLMILIIVNYRIGFMHWRLQNNHSATGFPNHFVITHFMRFCLPPLRPKYRPLRPILLPPILHGCVSGLFTEWINSFCFPFSSFHNACMNRWKPNRVNNRTLSS